VGASLLLGSTLADAAVTRPPAAESLVSERLAAIREAVFTVLGPGEISGEILKHGNPNLQLTWGNRWNNWGWRRRRRPPWNNWRNGWPNWNNFWRNW
jgi:hypothetical protein